MIKGDDLVEPGPEEIALPRLSPFLRPHESPPSPSRCEVVLVTDDEMRSAARWLWFEAGVAADLSGAAAVAALLSGRIGCGPDAKICALVCGAGPEGII
jgi:hypothetical protein